MRSRRLTLVVLTVVAAGCAGWREHGDTYYAKNKKTQATYTFGQPGDRWRPVRGNFEAVQVAWVEPNLVGIIELHVQCDEQGDSSLDQYTDHLRIDWTDWEVLEQREEKLAGREALRTRVRGKLDGVPRASEFLVVKKNGCLFDLRYSTKPEAFDHGRGDFDQVVQGFRFPVRG